MTVLNDAAPSIGDIDPSLPHNPTIDVEISGLPYVMEVNVPDEPKSFELTVGLPEQPWEDIKPKIEHELDNNSWFASQYHRIQQRLRLSEGKVGSVWVSAGQPPDAFPSIHIDRIQTENGYLPQESEYSNAKGVGSFILDSLCALADAKGWRIYLVPLERDGRLTGTDLIDWYERRGFEFNDGTNEHMNPDDAAMMRTPREPDTSQPILQLLTPSK